MEKLTFDQAMKRLNEIVAALDKNELELEKAITLFEEGLQLVTFCEGKLKGFEGKIEQLLKTSDSEKENQHETDL
ncbi:MAG: exodeoxyribonuclease VII small subunit [Erysipelotrichaceae bacterium]|nr:exodeoxyribonuclease VII small subunit [Erysipelotrichaceae bacterium]MDP3306262.1 exodeoxyribonuclease VII small subunit [Erysipelotrichaceae bacterium]